MKIGLIVDNGRVSQWQAQALRAIAEGNEFLLLDCTNSRSKRRPVRHGLYYALNLVSLRNRQTASVPLPPELRVAESISFEAEPDGAWERLPAALLEQLARFEPAVIVKFGMGLLRVPPPERLASPILSYHHGDPSRFRGRPAGFYELLTGSRTVGQVVQILSDRLDAGAIVAAAETKAHAYSWRKTLVDSYRVSPLLLPGAVQRALAGETLPVSRDGKNYSLPSNLTVARFIAKLVWAKARRLAYGAFFEKAWRVARAPLPERWSPESPDGLDEQGSWTVLPLPDGYSFLADPFFEPDRDTVLAEAMGPDGRGRIIRIHDSGVDAVADFAGHCSYPCTIAVGGRHYLVPEISDWSPPLVYEIGDGGFQEAGRLAIAGEPRLLDPTVHVHDGMVYLFANRADEGDGVLRLWVAEDLFSQFAEHPDSPVRISPAGARMAGLVLTNGGDLFRPGQDLRHRYGDAVLLFRIEELSPARYRESESARLGFSGHCGPHTLNLSGSTALFDYYDERFSLLAGFRRLRQSRVG